MIKIENVEVYGWEAAIRGMRNPMNSWDKSDSWNLKSGFKMGEKDHELAMKLVKAGAVHAKFRRMINVTFDITMPRYIAIEFDTYKVGTVTNSCSTMHKIHSKEFTPEDFSIEHLKGCISSDPVGSSMTCADPAHAFNILLYTLNYFRDEYLRTNNKEDWWQMIQLLPQSYNQKRTVQLNYEVLAHIYNDRRTHKLDEWRDFCKWIETLPYSELITGERNGE